jgi:glycosyltransferase involved in cell wall biosynthesis
MPALAPDHHFLLVLPDPCPDFNIPGLQVEYAVLQHKVWRSNLGKVVFEQAAFPWLSRRWGADVAHVPYWGSPLVPSVPTVVTVHDIIPLLLPAYRGGSLVRLYTRLVSASARRASSVLTDSLASKRDIERHLGLPESRVRCVYLAAGAHFGSCASGDDEGIRKQYGLQGRYVLYLAGHDVRKNVSGLIRAFATVAKADDDVTLVIGGTLPHSDRPRSLGRGASPLIDPRPLTDALGLTKRVRFIGWVEEAHKPALYRGTACAVFPSTYEGFGLPVLEALASGAPLVSSNVSSLPELVGDAGFAVNPESSDELAGAILSCLVDEPLAAELARRGPEQAAKFSWARTASDTLEVYREVMTGTEVGA